MSKLEKLFSGEFYLICERWFRLQFFKKTADVLPGIDRLQCGPDSVGSEFVVLSFGGNLS